MSENKTARPAMDMTELKRQLKEELLKEIKGEKAALSKPEAPDPYLEEYVEIQLFKDGKDYKDDVFVSCNGENCLIKRGVPVKIKRKFALILEQSAMQEVRAAEEREARRNEFKESPIFGN